MSIATALLGLLVLIFLHELGHFTAAKVTGMRALKFYVGFPPPLLRRRIGETEYALGAIPLGGYVKIPGMLRPEAGDLFEIDDILERNERLSEDAAAAIASALDDVRRELGRGRYDDARAGLAGLGRALEEAGDALGPAERRRAERALRRVGEGLDPRSYWRSSRRARLAVISAGPLANALVAFLLLFGVALTGKPRPAQPIPVVAAVLDGQPAATAGLRAGDRIVAVNGRPGGVGAIRRAIQRSDGRTIRLTVERHGQEVTLRPVRPRTIEGALRLGFVFDVRFPLARSYGPVAAVGVAAGDIWRMTTGTFSALAQVASPQGRSQLSGPVGIVRYSADAADIGWPYYLSLAALVSLSLAIFNLLPFLPLDGGHIFLVVLEKVRGRAISRAAFERVSAVGIMLMLIVFVIGLQNDLGRLVGTQSP
jgi:regulator of sigma E protease